MENKSIKHWIVLLCCCGLAGASIGVSINTSGVFYEPVSKSLGILRGDFAMHMTIFSIVTAITALFVPRIIKKVNYKLLLLVGILVGTLSTAAMSIGKNLFVFYILGAIRGISTGLFSAVTLTTIINQWFSEKHGLATSIVFGTSGLVGTFLSPILTSCIAHYGWQLSYVIEAAILCALCLPALLYPYHLNPQDDGLLPYGYQEKESDHEKEKTSHFHYFKITFISFFIYAIISSFITGVTQHLPGFAQSIGMNASTGALLLSAGMAGNIISKIIIGTLSDHIGALKATLTMMLMNALSVILLMTTSSSTLLVIAAFLFGSCYSIGAVGLPLLTKYFFGIENYDQAFPKVSFASNVGAAIALSLVGYVYDFFGSYYYAFFLVLAILLLGLILLLISNKK